jgi:type IV pilus assembly protein PilP
MNLWLERRIPPCKVNLLSVMTLVLVLVMPACGDDPPAAPAVPAKTAAAPAPRAAAPAKGGKGKKGATTVPTDLPPLPKAEFQEEDFAESERSRDPFRAYVDLFVDKADRRSLQRAKVLLEEYSLDDLKLIGVISRIVPAKAMVVDPAGKGHVIERNNLVGRAERVKAGSSNDEFEINWRVDRIRESDVVFVREDPANPDVPSATRIMSMRTAEEVEAAAVE